MSRWYRKYKNIELSMQISKMLNHEVPLNIIWDKWKYLRRRLLKKRYLSRKICEQNYGIDTRVKEIEKTEDWSDLILYYSDRWHPSRVRTFDEAFKKIKNLDEYSSPISNMRLILFWS